MTPTNHACANQLKHMIYYNLDLNLLENALFIAGRLHAYEPRASESAYLVALCNFRLQRYKAAYECSKNSATRGTHLGCAYVFAQACLSMGRYQEGAHAIERLHREWKSRNSWAKHTDTRRQPLPDAAAFLCILGHLCRAMGDGNKASIHYSESLKLNPFMWEALTALCDMGVEIRTNNIFVASQALLGTPSSSEDCEAPEDTKQMSTGTVVNDPFSVSTSRANAELRRATGKSTLSEKLNEAVTHSMITIANGVFDTPSNTGMMGTQGKEPPTNNGDSDVNEPPQAPLRRNRTILGAGSSGTDVGVNGPPRMKAPIPKLRKVGGEAEETDIMGLGIVADRKRTVSGHAAQSGSVNGSSRQHSMDTGLSTARRSVRIFNSATSRPQSTLTGITNAIPRDIRDLKRARPTSVKVRANAATVGRVVSSNRKHDPVDVDGKEPRSLSATTTHISRANIAIGEKIKDAEALHNLLDVFRILASGYLELSRFRCQEAIATFNSLPQAQRDTPWVLSQVAKAHFEQSSWLEAEKVYNRIRTIAPARVEDLEFYSTVLWHLKREVELSFLAHEVMDLDRLSPQAWCIIGNSLSLQRDHDGALKCFKRAAQLDPKFAYAFTLQGHEHIAGEEYDKALEAFRSAVTADSRHYKAWYGIGQVYEKQGRFDFAEAHYQLATSINPTNSILVACIGMVLEKMKKSSAALGYYNRSIDLAPKSTMARYKKARVLMGMGEPKQALSELLIVKDMSPDEGPVHFLLGKVYRSLQDNGNALKHFTTALNIDPKASPHIKEAMEQIEDHPGEDDMMT